MARCAAATCAGDQCSRIGKIELLVERPDGTRTSVPLCVHHHRLILRNRGRGLYEDGTIWYEPKPYKPGMPWLEPDSAESEEPSESDSQ